MLDMKKSVLKYEVSLDNQQRKFLENITSKGKESARKIKRANILLLADEGKKDKEIMEIVRVSDFTVEKIRKRFVLEGLENALEEKPRTGQPKKIDGRGEAFLIAKACSAPPAGRTRWTIRLLEENLIELNISDTTIQRTLKKMKLSLG
jgi:transposase